MKKPHYNPLFLSLLSAGGSVSKRQTAAVQCVPQPRQLCTHTKGTSQYYDHCIEQIFPCGEEGFTLAYAKPRSEAIEELDDIDTDLKGWLHATEACFQEELYALVYAKSRTQFPSKQTCLALEKAALEKMNECHKKHTSLCTILTNAEEASLQVLHQHLHTIVNAFRIGGEYYNNTIVDLGIPEAIRGCSGHTELADSLVSKRLPLRIMMCISSEEYYRENGTRLSRQIAPTEYTNILSSKLLHRPIEQFVYSREDTLEQCKQLTNGEQYHIVTWFADPEDEKALNWNNSALAPVWPVPSLRVWFFELKESEDDGVPPRAYSQCGDGIRQAGEMCDFGGESLSACDLTCQTVYGYECNTDNLAPSECRIVAPQTHSSLPVPCSTSIRRSGVQRSRSSRQETISPTTRLSQESQDSLKLGLPNAVSAAFPTRSPSLSFQTLTLAGLVLFTLHCLSSMTR